LTLRLLAVKPVAHPHLQGSFGLKGPAAVSTATRTALVDGKSAVLPLYRVEEQKAGAHARGPCVLEEAFFTSRIDAGWSFEINQAGDILLSRA
ncbi:MAG: hydantoinase/oxoprolinase family protein, partial [Pseudomonadota bacterium]|nr:hydantoinase/oxoprolinase family protein [Pseudomonadota bacterium]